MTWLMRQALRQVHAFGYWLWCWTDDHMPDDEPRCS